MADCHEELLAALDRLLALERPVLAEVPGSDPAAARTLGREARELNEAGRYTEALEVCGRIEELGADTAWQHAYKGLGYRGLGRWVEAFRCFERSLEHGPAVSYSWFLLADCLAALGRVDRALDASDRGLELGPGDAAGWIQRAAFLDGLGRREEAVNGVLRALQLDPGKAAAEAKSRGIQLACLAPPGAC